ncbi:translesion DNA synthesis-associated protein ImuA [Frateuria aurantia]
MASLAVLSELLDRRQVWRGRGVATPEGAQPTGWEPLDAVLPGHGWPPASVSEILLPHDGVGELRLVLPTLARLTRGRRPVVLVSPPYRPCAMGWRQRGVDLQHLHLLEAGDAMALWAAEQCLRSGSCGAVMVWPKHADERALRRLQVAADSGRALGFVFRPVRQAIHASPVALRLELTVRPQPAIWVRKCRGGRMPVRPVPFAETGT